MLSAAEVQSLLEKVIPQLISQVSPDIYLVRLHIAEGHKITLWVDTDQGIEIGICTKLHRLLRDALEALPGVNEHYELEVSSPGLGEPIVLPRQYRRHMGRLLRLRLDDGSELTGHLRALSDEALQLEPQAARSPHKPNKPNKPKALPPVQVPLARIQTSQILVSFT